MPKYFVDAKDIHGDRIQAGGETAHHLLHVLRMKRGDYVLIGDGQGMDYHCAIVETRAKDSGLTLAVQNVTPSLTEPPVRVTLYQALPKSDKMEWIIQKGVELGVHDIVPVVTARTVTRVKDTDTRSVRYSRISEAAAAQSMRGIIPQVGRPMPLAEAVSASREDFRIAAYENEHNESILAALQGNTPETAGVFIGPEGGFTDEEIALFVGNGIRPVTLGPRILRTETAGMVALAQVMCALEVFRLDKKD